MSKCTHSTKCIAHYYKALSLRISSRTIPLHIQFHKFTHIHTNCPKSGSCSNLVKLIREATFFALQTNVYIVAPEWHMALNFAYLRLLKIFKTHLWHSASSLLLWFVQLISLYDKFVQRFFSPFNLNTYTLSCIFQLRNTRMSIVCVYPGHKRRRKLLQISQINCPDNCKQII